MGVSFDILWQNGTTNEFQVWSIDDQGVKHRATVLDERGNVFSIGSPWSFLGAGDSDGNGKSDLLFRNTITDAVDVVFMDAENAVRRATYLDEGGNGILPGPVWRIVAAGDFDGSGQVDLVCQNGATGEIAIWYTNGLRVFERKTVVHANGNQATLSSPWSIIGTADLSGKGRVDLLWHNPITHQTQCWLMDEEKLTQQETLIDANGPIHLGPEWSFIGAKDIDGDGKTDLLWHSNKTGITLVLHMNGHRNTGRSVVLDEFGNPVSMPPPWIMRGVGLFTINVLADAGWFQIHPETKMRPGATISALETFEGHVDLFAVASNGTVWSTFYDRGSGWNNPWFAIHPDRKMWPGSRVSAVQTYPGHVDLYATGMDGIVWTTYYEVQSEWLPWFAIHPEMKMHPRSNVSVLLPYAGHVDLFATGPDGTVWTTFWDRTWKQPWFPIRPERKMSPGATVSVLKPYDGHVDLFVTDAEGVVWTTYWEGGWDTPWFPIGAETKMQPGTTITAYFERRPFPILMATDSHGTVWQANWKVQWDASGQEWSPVGWGSWGMLFPETSMWPGATTALATDETTVIIGDSYGYYSVDATGTVWGTTIKWKTEYVSFQLSRVPEFATWAKLPATNQMDHRAVLTVLELSGILKANSEYPERKTIHTDLFVTGLDGSVWSTFWERNDSGRGLSLVGVVPTPSDGRIDETNPPGDGGAGGDSTDGDSDGDSDSSSGGTSEDD